uniref:Uncharacterized protein n=1 Tax=Arundo donax TaxID=35708 RepID=A0A0A9A4A8_ARUDO
MQSESRCTCRN